MPAMPAPRESVVAALILASRGKWALLSGRPSAPGAAPGKYSCKWHAPCRPLDLVCAVGDCPFRQWALQLFMRCKNSTAQNKAAQSAEISCHWAPLLPKTRSSLHACATFCHQRSRMSGGEAFLAGLGSSGAPHPATQHARKPQRRQKSGSTSLTVRRTGALDVCAGPGHLARVGLGSSRSRRSVATGPPVSRKPRKIAARLRDLLPVAVRE